MFLCDNVPIKEKENISSSDYPQVSNLKPLENLTFVFSGVFESINRERIEQFVIELGARMTSAVSGKTDYLIVGSKLEDGRDITTATKYKKAKEKNVTILNEQDFEELMREKIGNPWFTLDNYQNWKIIEPKQIETANAAFDVPDDIPSVHKRGASMLLTEKYKPMKISDLVGNKANIDSLIEWLKDWDDVHVRGNKKQVRAVRGNWSNVAKLNAKASLISGPPGIGKTSSARIVCAELGFEVLEMNASDTRNKKKIESMIGELSSNNSIDYYIENKENRKENKFSIHKKSVIIMDEVDGCGGGDRGGISALIQIIKTTKTPIICICNDRESRKLASLINHWLDIKFMEPSIKQITARIHQIAKAEGLEVEDSLIHRLAEESRRDIRQVITQIQFMMTTSNSLKLTDMNNSSNKMSKDKILYLNNFNAANKLLNYSEYSKMSYSDKLSMFFVDYDFVPLLVQENYLSAFEPNIQNRKYTEPQRLAQAANFIALGDVVNQKVRGEMQWSLLSDNGFASSIAPCFYTKGSINTPIFPGWLGKNSTCTKSKRLINEIRKAMGHRVLWDNQTLQNDYLPIIFDLISEELINENYQKAIDILDEMNISNELFKENIAPLIFDQKKAKKLDKIGAQSKAAFTRTYNATHSTSFKAKKKKREASKIVEDDLFDPDRDEAENEADIDQDSEEEDIEIVPTKKTSAKSKGKAKASKSKKPKSKGKNKK